MTPAAPEKLQDGRKSVAFSPFPYRGKTCYDADNGTGERRRSRHGVYRGLLRVQTINAEIRPTNVSRIISIRIIKDPPFRFQRRPGLLSRAFLF